MWGLQKLLFSLWDSLVQRRGTGCHLCEDKATQVLNIHTLYNVFLVISIAMSVGLHFLTLTLSLFATNVLCVAYFILHHAPEQPFSLFLCISHSFSSTCFPPSAPTAPLCSPALPFCLRKGNSYNTVVFYTTHTISSNYTYTLPALCFDPHN